LAESLRSARLDRQLSSMALQYATWRKSNLEILTSDASLQDIARSEFLGNWPELSADNVIAAINAKADAGFRTEMWKWVESSASNPYRDEIISVLTLSRSEGADLKAEVLASVTSLRNSVDARVSSFFNSVDTPYERERDIVIRGSIEDLMTSYATRGTTARTTLQPIITSLADNQPVAQAKVTLKQKVEELLTDAAVAGIRRDLIGMIEKGVDTASLKTALTQYLTGLVDPDASALTLLRNDLYERELLKSIALSDMVDTYKEEDFPEELREIILLRSYEKAEERYARYERLRASNTQTERESASLDLTGLMGDMARHILVTDFAKYTASHPVADYIAGGEGRRSVNDYLSAYLLDRNTNSTKVPDLAVLMESLAAADYQRMMTDAGTAGGLHLLD
ncbi:MAG: hypothetical protein CVV45_21040, partial [Spirochaetae bacterium HGW-Spirochaetae-10]